LKLKEAQRMKDEADSEVDWKVWYLDNKLSFFLSLFKVIYRFRIYNIWFGKSHFTFECRDLNNNTKLSSHLREIKY
jgi:hypothetical protein